MYKYGTSPKDMPAYIHMHRSMYTCIYFYMHTYIYRCTPVYIISLYYLYKYRYLHTNICRSILPYMDMSANMHIFLCTYIHTHTYMQHMHTLVCSFNRIHVYIGVSTQIRHVSAYNHIYTCAYFLSLPC